MNSINFKKRFISFEGEGPNIGAKTLFLTYDKNEGDYRYILEEIMQEKVNSIYINTDFFDLVLLDFVKQLSEQDMFVFTYEMPLVNFIAQDYNALSELKGSFFLRHTSNMNNHFIVNMAPNFPVIAAIKIEATESNFSEMVELANKYKILTDLDVYLMPLFSNKVGEIMMKHIDLIEADVKVMPPTQFLINMQ